MKDKITKRVKVDYKSLIKGHGLWSVFKRFKKSHPRIKSEKRLMYCFCKSWLKEDLLRAVAFEANIEEHIRIANYNCWED